MRLRLLDVIAMAVILLASCNSDTRLSDELEENLQGANDEVASVESDPFTATPTSIATTTSIAIATLDGTVTLRSGDHTSNAGSTACWGDGGYDDISEGTSIVVRDGEGSVIGTSLLGVGVRVEDTRDFGNYSFWRCTFSFAVSVPPDSPFYAVEIPNGLELTYSNADMITLHWTVDFNLG